MHAIFESLNQELSQIIRAVQPALVQLTNGHRGSGAGTIWQADGLIITNAHVVQRHAPTVTLSNGRTFSSKLVAYDEKLDLAALAIDAADLPTVILGDSQALKAGDWVVALGHPWGIVGAASAGAVIDVGPPLEWNRSDHQLLQVGIQLRPGHSGGPMLDSNGRLVGINTMISGPQVGYAIPVHVVQRFLQEQLTPVAVAA